MCLAVPALILSRKDDRGDVDFGGVRREVNLALVPDAKVGEYVIVHAGFAIQHLDEEEARTSLEAWAEVMALGGGRPNAG